MNIKHLLGIKKLKTENKIKQYFFGVLVYKRKTFENEIKMYHLGIPTFKIKNYNGYIKIYFWGIQILSYKNFEPQVIHVQVPTLVPVSDDNKDKNILNIKAFELINSRLNCRYEKGESENENID